MKGTKISASIEENPFTVGPQLHSKKEVSFAKSHVGTVPRPRDAYTDSIRIRM